MPFRQARRGTYSCCIDRGSRTPNLMDISHLRCHCAISTICGQCGIRIRITWLSAARPNRLDDMPLSGPVNRFEYPHLRRGHRKLLIQESFLGAMWNSNPPYKCHKLTCYPLTLIVPFKCGNGGDRTLDLKVNSFLLLPLELHSHNPRNLRRV